MKHCDCGRISMFIKTETRGRVAVDLFKCRQCGNWEDYRLLKTPSLTDVPARMARQRAYSRNWHKATYWRRKSEALP